MKKICRAYCENGDRCCRLLDLKSSRIFTHPKGDNSSSNSSSSNSGRASIDVLYGCLFCIGRWHLLQKLAQCIATPIKLGPSLNKKGMAPIEGTTSFWSPKPHKTAFEGKPRKQHIQGPTRVEERQAPGCNIFGTISKLPHTHAHLQGLGYLVFHELRRRRYGSSSHVPERHRQLSR